MKNKLLLLCFSAFSIVSSYSQTTLIYYFDKDLNITTKSKSVFTGKATDDSGRLKLKCYNNNKLLIFEAHYVDSTLAVMEGLFRSYYENGFPENEGNYSGGKENGVWKKWNSSGDMTDSSVYKNGKLVMHGTFTYHRNKGIQSVSIFDENEHFVKASYYDENGKFVRESNEQEEDKVFTKMDISPSFPGGDAGWGRYIKKAIEQSIDELVTDNKSGTCVVRFIVNKDGNVSEVEAITMKNSVLAKVAVKAIKTGPNWIPGMQNGRKVTAFREQPVTFTIANR